ncbi:MAG: hypothetical protein ACOZF2_12230 [Thermodesulfobacteriota bacterium]
MNHGKSQKLLFYFVSFVLAIIVIEVGLQLINGVASMLRKKQNDNPLLLYYQDQKMANQIWQETWDTLNDREYNQFLGWTDKPYHGLYVNEDVQTGRKTWNPETPKGQKLAQVYFFGGSAAWGLGARDNYTIPSYLSRMLNKHGARFQVFNYSVPGYTFMQGILHLILLLKEGHSPRYVIFYDGFNEIYAAHQHGIAGTVHNQFMTKEKLKLKYRDIIWKGITEAIRKYCMIYKAINGLYLSISKEPKYLEIAEKYSDDQLRSLSRDIVDDYKKSIKVLDQLSKAYEFKYICFWQPSILTERHLMKEESNIDIRAEDKAFKKLCIYTDEYLQKENIPHFYLLTHIFDKRSESVYVDVAHISEKGNEIIANNIYGHMQKELFSNNRVNRQHKDAINLEYDIVVFPGAAVAPERHVQLWQWRQNAGFLAN